MLTTILYIAKSKAAETIIGWQVVTPLDIKVSTSPIHYSLGGLFCITNVMKDKVWIRVWIRIACSDLFGAWLSQALISVVLGRDITKKLPSSHKSSLNISIMPESVNLDLAARRIYRRRVLSRVSTQYSERSGDYFSTLFTTSPRRRIAERRKGRSGLSFLHFEHAVYINHRCKYTRCEYTPRSSV